MAHKYITIRNSTGQIVFLNTFTVRIYLRSIIMFLTLQLFFNQKLIISQSSVLPGICTQGVQAVAFRTSQGRKSQICRSSLPPSHSAPPCCGAGLSHTRRLSRHPAAGPHPAPPALAHGDHAPHADHAPSTGASAKSVKYFNGFLLASSAFQNKK